MPKKEGIAMIAMQYKIQLPADYDMNLIRQRVSLNGTKTDGFPDLIFKAYLVSEKGSTPQNSNNEYSPLYLWKNNDGMNQFIFNGYYDNILKTFGWQKINIGVPSSFELRENFVKSKFVLEVEKEILKRSTMEPLSFSRNFKDCTGKLLIYNPDKWKYAEYYFFENSPKNLASFKIYKILHLSM